MHAGQSRRAQSRRRQLAASVLVSGPSGTGLYNYWRRPCAPHPSHCPHVGPAEADSISSFIAFLRILRFSFYCASPPVRLFFYHCTARRLPPRILVPLSCIFPASCFHLLIRRIFTCAAYESLSFPARVVLSASIRPRRRRDPGRARARRQSSLAPPTPLPRSGA